MGLLRRIGWPTAKFAITAAFYYLGFSKEEPDALRWLYSIDTWLNTNVAHPSVVAIAIGLTAGFIVVPGAWKAVSPFISRPELKIEFFPEKVFECIFDLPLEDRFIRQFRIKITNNSGVVLNRCRGRIDRIASFHYDKPYVEKVPLTWAYQFNHVDVDLQNGQSLPLNVLQVTFFKNWITYPIVSPISHTEANNKPIRFDRYTAYNLTIVVSSDEGKTKNIDFDFIWTGDIETTRIENVRISKPPA